MERFFYVGLVLYKTSSETVILAVHNVVVKKRKRRCFGFISMSPGLAKRVQQGSVQGKRTGRQKKRWEGSITEWTGITLDSTTRAAENKTIWTVICGVPTTLQPLDRP